MDFITVREASALWDIDVSRIGKLMRASRIPGATKIGGHWVIPRDTPKPADGRTKAGKSKKRAEADTFRYPSFEFKDASTFYPPLSEEEQTIKGAIEAANAFRFQYAGERLGDLPERAQSRYIRIAALYCRCIISVFLCDATRFQDCYGRLKRELQEDFPHRLEMREYIYAIDSFLGSDECCSEGVREHPTYGYHESFQPRLCNLSALRLVLCSKQITPADFAPHELNCSFLEKTDNYFDVQALHIYLACAYSMHGEKEACKYHFRRALHLAERYDEYLLT